MITVLLTPASGQVLFTWQSVVVGVGARLNRGVVLVAISPESLIGSIDDLCGSWEPVSKKARRGAERAVSCRGQLKNREICASEPKEKGGAKRRL